MKQKLNRTFPGLALVLALALGACSSNPSGPDGSTDVYLPQAPDYADAAMWHTRLDDPQGTGADVLYFVSTWEADWTTTDGRLCHHADPVGTPGHRERMDREIGRVASYMGPGNNFYSPYYRHMTIEGWATLNEDTVAARFRPAFDDLQRAFDTWQRQRPARRPFVLAGFSQGGKAVVELLKVMPDSLRPYLVAAYVLGYKVTPADTLASPNLRPARGATDLGVTVCYNSVSDVRYIQPIVAAPCAMCINPVNWRTDATPATLHDTITVSVSPEHHVLVLQGYSGAEYAPIMGFLNVGDFHSCEPWLYQECLERNVADRIRAFKERAE